MTRPRPGVDAPLDVLEAGVVTTVRGMDEATAARILPDLERMCDTVRLFATSPDLGEDGSFRTAVSRSWRRRPCSPA